MPSIRDGRIEVYGFTALRTPPALRSRTPRFGRKTNRATDDRLTGSSDAFLRGAAHDEDTSCDLHELEAPRAKVRVEQPPQPLLCPCAL